MPRVSRRERSIKDQPSNARSTAEKKARAYPCAFRLQTDNHIRFLRAAHLYWDRWHPCRPVVPFPLLEPQVAAEPPCHRMTPQWPNGRPSPPTKPTATSPERDAVAVWQEKLRFLLEQMPILSDPAQKYAGCEPRLSARRPLEVVCAKIGRILGIPR